MSASYSSARTIRGRATPAGIPGVIRLLDLWQSRRALSRLDARTLDDIGLTRDVADMESQRPLWDVPNNWRR